MKTVIFCAGQNGRTLKSMLQKDLIAFEDGCKSDEILFCDNNMELIRECFIEGCSIVAPQSLCCLGPDDRIVISSPNNVDSVMNQLLEMGLVQKVYVSPAYVYKFAWNNTNMPPLVTVDIHKPRLNKLQIPIIEACNLNCKGCNLIYNLSSQKRMTIEEFESELTSLRRLFSGIDKLTLLGGEPFLHPELSKFIILARTFFPDANLEIRTNGTLLHTTDELLLKTIAETYTEVGISVYPPIYNKQDEIGKCLRKKGIRYRFLGPFFEFRKIINPKGDYDPDEIHSQCELCTNLINGELSCGLGSGIDTLEKHFGVVLCNEDCTKLNRINIHTTELNGWEIIKTLMEPSKLCSFCAYQNSNIDTDHIVFPWNSGKPELSDWIV